MNGNLTDWWQEIDSSEFKKRTDLIRKQYSQYQVLDKFVDGDLTLGENIADNGGLVIAFEAMKEYIRVNPGKVEEGQQEFSIEQRFFISNARLWRTVARKELQLKLLKIDPHSPGRYRIDGVVKNVDAFYDAFGVVRGDNLWLDEQDRVKIF